MSAGVLLYGPPASGKDTVTKALVDISGGRFALFPKLKVLPNGNGGTGYRLANRATLVQLRSSGDVLYENERYGNVYVVDRQTLTSMFEDHDLVVHMGQVEGVRAVRRRFPAHWLTVALWCSRRTAEERMQSRGSVNVADRLQAWDETATDFFHASPEDFALRIDTDATSAYEAAQLIIKAQDGLA